MKAHKPKFLFPLSPNFRDRSWILLPILLCLALSGCKLIKRHDQPYYTNSVLLKTGATVGQSFVAQHAGLAGIQVYLSAQNPGEGEILLHLRRDAGTTTEAAAEAVEDLAVSSLELKTVKKARYYSFSFSPQAESPRQDYYFWLEIRGDGEVQVFTAGADAYLDGALYQDNTPQEGQLTFGAMYEPGWMIRGLIRLGFCWLGILLVGIFLFILPGWALLSWLWAGWEKHAWFEKLALSAGISLVVYPILMLWTSLIGLRLGAIYAWLPPLAGGMLLLIRNRSKINLKSFKGLTTLKPTRENLTTSIPPIIATSVILLGIIFTRFWPLHTLDAPMWGDSYQHSLITQLMIDNRGLFNSWLPYAELKTFTYHFGFHSAAAVFHWASGLSAPEAVMWVGQLLNILAVLAVYPLATRLGKNRWSGTIALLLAGLLSPMPMTYVNWGRYTQLTGQVILPVAIYLIWDHLERESLDWRLVGLTSLAFGGLALTHYRILILAILFIPAWLILQLQRGRIIDSGLRSLWVGLGGGILFLPWFVHVFQGKILAIFSRQLSTPASEAAVAAGTVNNFGNLFTYLPAWLWILLPISIGWGLWKRNKTTALISVWWLLILIAANPEWLKLPGTGAITNFAVLIAFYLPASVMIAPLPIWFYETLVSSSPFIRSFTPKHTFSVLVSRLIHLVPLLLVAPLLVYGTSQRLHDVNPFQSALLSRPDIRAAEWIRANIPDDAIFLVNGIFAYNNTVVVGSDGGWWLPLLTHRRNTIPPLNYGSEQGFNDDLASQVKQIYQSLFNNGLADMSTRRYLIDNNIRYIYIGQRNGGVNNSQPSLLQPEILLTIPGVQSIYHRDRVWIFKIIEK